MIGMNNTLLNVNLSKTGNEFSTEKIDDEVLKQYIGGRALGVKLLTDMLNPKIDPLSPENVLLFAVGPFAGTSVPTNGRFALVTKSPLTNGIFFSNSGGSFGVHMKRCGYDTLVIKGASSNPIYIVLDGNQCSIKDASGLWGLDTEETMAKLKEIEGKTIHALMIGPAGENVVRIANIMNDAERAFGRGGVGAIMGSKKVKAIVVKNGDKKTEVKDKERLDHLVQSAVEKIRVVPITRSALPKFGTSGLVNVINELGMFPINNFQKGYDPQAENVSGESIRNNIFIKDEGCYACPIRCGRLTKAGDMQGKGPEYESVWALGPNLGVFDLITITQVNYWCNKLGIDTISCGGVIACAMELQQKGLLKDTSIKFGNKDILIDLVKKIAKREGIGLELSEGSAILSRKYNSPDSAIHVKGLDLPAYDPRGAMGHALGYATSNRGGCHLTGYLAAMEIFAAPKKIDRFTTGGKADLLVLKQNTKVIEDSLVTCAFAGWALSLDFYARFLTAITGIEYTNLGLQDIGRKVYTMERLFNIKAGLGSKDDLLPPRFLNTPLVEGFSKDKVVPVNIMLKDYYFIRGWDEKGVPKPELLKELGLSGGD